MEQDKNGMHYGVEGGLNEVISHFYHIYHTEGEPVIKHLSPSLEMLLVLNFGTDIAISFNNLPSAYKVQKGCAVLGPLRQMLNYELKPGADAIVVNFRLNGFYRLFEVPLNSFDGQSAYNPDKLTEGLPWQELWEELSKCTDIRARLSLLEGYLSQYINGMDDAAQVLVESEHFFDNPSTHPVKAIASAAGLTERTIQIRFQKYAGFSPKELLRFLRFKMVINRLLSNSEKSFDMIEIVTEFNFHDQSHLIKDFKHFLGKTPQQFLKDLKGKEFFLIGQEPENRDTIS